VSVNEIPVLVDWFRLKQERTRFEEVTRIALSRSEDNVPTFVLHSQLDPTLDHVERTGGIEPGMAAIDPTSERHHHRPSK
jgi:hypothetical protein